MAKFFSTYRNGININFKCYKLKKPFRPVCDKTELSDCLQCKFCRADMLARDAERLMTVFENAKYERIGKKTDTK